MPDTDTLIQRYLEGLLTEDEAAQLHALLIGQPQLGGQLLQHLHLDAMLRDTKPLIASASAAPVLLPKRRFSISTLVGVAALAACVTLAGTWALLSFTHSSTEAEETSASVAVLTRAVNLEWESTPLSTGTPLSPGWLRIKSGIAQIEFYQGARVSIEGPAQFQIVSSGEATCTSGKLSAHVPPPAKGFRINTPRGTIVDLGTEFGLDVSAAAAEVHVFKGEVELHQPKHTLTSLREGQALTVTDIARPLTVNPTSFASLSQIDERSVESQRSQFERWQLASARLNLDPSLRLHFDFQDDSSSRSLRNRATSPGAIADGSIVGGAWTDGRWPGKRALDFRNVSDRVRLKMTGDTRALTLFVWVRVNGLDRPLNSLFMSEGWGQRRVHWQITREGKVRLGVAGAASARHTDYDSPVLFTPERFGRWLPLAVVFDPEKNEVRHYANGGLAARLPIKDASPLSIGIAELGNWNDLHSPSGVAIRHLSGTMDEFALWDRALSDTEIAALAQ